MSDDCVLSELLADRVERANGTRLTHDEIVRLSTIVAEMVAERLQRLGAGQVWMTSKDVAHRTSTSTHTINAALQDGSLHGHQVKAGGRWRVRVEVVDAWMREVSDKQQAEVCGCVKLSVPATRSRRR